MILFYILFLILGYDFLLMNWHVLQCLLWETLGGNARRFASYYASHKLFIEGSFCWINFIIRKLHNTAGSLCLPTGLNFLITQSSTYVFFGSPFSGSHFDLSPKWVSILISLIPTWFQEINRIHNKSSLNGSLTFVSLLWESVLCSLPMNCVHFVCRDIEKKEIQLLL